MEFETIVQSISTVGFPIIIALLFYFQSTKTTDKLTTLIENNTKALTELKNKIDK